MEIREIISDIRGGTSGYITCPFCNNITEVYLSGVSFSGIETWQYQRNGKTVPSDVIEYLANRMCLDNKNQEQVTQKILSAWLFSRTQFNHVIYNIQCKCGFSKQFFTKTLENREQLKEQIKLFQNEFNAEKVNKLKIELSNYIRSKLQIQKVFKYLFPMDNKMLLAAKLDPKFTKNNYQLITLEKNISQHDLLCTESHAHHFQGNKEIEFYLRSYRSEIDLAFGQMQRDSFNLNTDCFRSAVGIILLAASQKDKNCSMTDFLNMQDEDVFYGNLLKRLEPIITKVLRYISSRPSRHLKKTFDITLLEGLL